MRSTKNISFIILVSVFLLGQTSKTQSTEVAAAGSTRVVHFPRDRSMGLVYVGDLRPTDPLWWQGWEEVGEARGDVIIPAQKDVRLVINRERLQNLSFLGALRPDDIQALIFRYGDGKRADDTALEHLAKLAGLRLLSLYNAAVTDAGLERLTKLKKLEALTLGSTKITDNGLKYIGQIRSLRHLNLGLTPVTDEGLAHLRNLSSLRTITLERTGITGTGFSHLVGLDSLTYVHLAGSSVADEGLCELAKLKSLEKLNLSGTKVGDRGIAYLESLKMLRELNLENTNVTNAGLDHIAQLTSLEHLQLPDGTTDVGLQKLTSLTKIKHLDISLMQYQGNGLAALRQFQRLEHLKPPSEITDKELAVISTLTSLRELWINNSPITNEGLARLGALKSLEKLILHNGWTSIDMRITASGLSALKGLPLTYLWLYNINLDDSRFESLVEFTELEELHLKQMPIHDQDLAIAGKLPRLKFLEFMTDTVSDGGLAYLVGLPSLEVLMPWTSLTDKGLYHIGKMKGLKRLVVKGEFTDKGLAHIEDLKSLRQLTMTTSGQISDTAMERLKKHLPHLGNFRLRKTREFQPRPEVGAVAPSFTLPTFDGKEIKLESCRGKAVLLYFWATWCSPCVASTPGLKQLHGELKKAHQDRFVMLGLSLDPEEASARRYVEKEAIPWLQVCIGLHSQMAADYGVTGVPMYFVIGPNGRIVSTDDKWGKIEAAIDRVLGQ